MSQRLDEHSQVEPTLSRRSMSRMLAGGAFAMVGGGLLLPRSADAGLYWCRTDPRITVDGATGNCYVDSLEEMLSAANGPIQIEVYVPVGSTASAEPLDNGFGFGYSISILQDKGLKRRGDYSDVRVHALAPASDGSISVRVYFRSNLKPQFDTTVYGEANDWIISGVVKI